MVDNTLDLSKLDKRVATRYLRKGLLDQKEYDKFLKTLPDQAHNALPVEATIEPMEVGKGGSHPDEE